MESLIEIVFDFRVWVIIILGIIVNHFVSHTPRIVHGYWKVSRLKKLRKIRRVRLNPTEVTYEIAKSNTYFLLFALIGVMYLMFLIMGPLGKVAEQSILLMFIFISPLYVSEIFWLLQDNYAKRLVKASRCIHVKRYKLYYNKCGCKGRKIVEFVTDEQ
jgi:hypothetical protein